MGSTVKPTEMRELIDAAIQKDTRLIESCGSSENPQTIQMVQQAMGRVEAWKTCYDYLNGFGVTLRISAGEF